MRLARPPKKKKMEASESEDMEGANDDNEDEQTEDEEEDESDEETSEHKGGHSKKGSSKKRKTVSKKDAIKKEIATSKGKVNWEDSLVWDKDTKALSKNTFNCRAYQRALSRAKSLKLPLEKCKEIARIAHAAASDFYASHQ